MKSQILWRVEFNEGHIAPIHVSTQLKRIEYATRAVRKFIQSAYKGRSKPTIRGIQIIGLVIQ